MSESRVFTKPIRVMALVIILILLFTSLLYAVIKPDTVEPISRAGLSKFFDYFNNSVMPFFTLISVGILVWTLRLQQTAIEQQKIHFEESIQSQRIHIQKLDSQYEEKARINSFQQVLSQFTYEYDQHQKMLERPFIINETGGLSVNHLFFLHDKNKLLEDVSPLFINKSTQPKFISRFLDQLFINVIHLIGLCNQLDDIGTEKEYVIIRSLKNKTKIQIALITDLRRMTKVESYIQTKRLEF